MLGHTQLQGKTRTCPQTHTKHGHTHMTATGETTTHIHTQWLGGKYIRTLTLSHSHAHRHTQTGTQAHTLMHMHTDTFTHTHTHRNPDLFKSAAGLIH